MPLAHRSLLLDLARAGERLVSVGERGHILVSDDGGRQWRQVAVPLRSTLTGVYFVDARNGWAVGHDAAILRSTDGGDSWRIQYYDAAGETPLLDVWFRDIDRGIAVGAYGLLLETFDGGATWNQRRLIEEDDFHLNQISATADGQLWVAAEAGNLYTSNDQGLSWEVADSPYEGSLFGVLPLAPETLLLYGLRGHLFRSSDGGASWTPIETGVTALLHGAARLDDGGAVVVGMDGMILRAGPGSDGFRVYPQPDRLGLTAVLQVGDALVMSGEGGLTRLDLDRLEP